MVLLHIDSGCSASGQDKRMLQADPEMKEAELKGLMAKTYDVVAYSFTFGALVAIAIPDVIVAMHACMHARMHACMHACMHARLQA